MLKQKILGLSIAFIAVSACVPAKKFNKLKQDYADLEQENSDLSHDMQDCASERDVATTKMDLLQEEYATQSRKLQDLQENYKQLKQNHENLQNSYDALEKNSSSALAENSRQNRELLATLEEKQKTLQAEKSRLEKLQKDLKARSERVEELEGLIAATEAKMQALKTSVSKALTDFEGKGLTVERRNGKVYVSMENKLLFGSGSWSVGTNGRKAVKQLGSVLAQNPDINVLIEGHTDDVPYGGNGPLQDNWDLSTKRATSIVHILQENNNINPKNLTAAGRGEYAPVAPNSTTEGKAKNRRIEVILTPKLDEVNKILGDF